MSRPIGCLIIYVHSSPGGASVAVLERHSGFVHVARKPTKVPLLLLLHASNASGVSMRHLLGALALALILDLLKFEVRHERRLAALGARPGAKGRGQQPLSNAFGVKHVPAWKLGDLDTDLVILQAEGALGFHFIALDSDRALVGAFGTRGGGGGSALGARSTRRRCALVRIRTRGVHHELIDLFHTAILDSSLMEDSRSPVRNEHQDEDNPD